MKPKVLVVNLPKAQIGLICSAKRISRKRCF